LRVKAQPCRPEPKPTLPLLGSTCKQFKHRTQKLRSVANSDLYRENAISLSTQCNTPQCWNKKWIQCMISDNVHVNMNFKIVGPCIVTDLCE
jgi:hypothetical protein